jgi:hypothetical protein
MGKSIKDLEFTPYSIGDKNRHLATSSSQANSLNEFVTNLSIADNFNAILAFHSSPTDEAAFCAAACVFSTAIQRGLTCQCLSTSQIVERDLPDAKDLYVIHSVMDTDHPKAIWALRDFLRDREGSLRIVVMTSGKEHNVESIVHERMKMKFDYLFCLEDSVSRLDYSHTFKSKPVEQTTSNPTYRRAPSSA